MVSMLWLLAALPATPALPDTDAFLESPVRATAAVYSPAAKERIEAGWRSSEEPRLGVPTFFWAPRPPAEATALRELGLTAEQAARRWLFIYGELYRQSPLQLAGASVQEIHDLGDGAVVVTTGHRAAARSARPSRRGPRRRPPGRAGRTARAG